MSCFYRTDSRVKIIEIVVNYNIYGRNGGKSPPKTSQKNMNMNLRNLWLKPGFLSEANVGLGPDRPQWPHPRGPVRSPARSDFESLTTATGRAGSRGSCPFLETFWVWFFWLYWFFGFVLILYFFDEVVSKSLCCPLGRWIFWMSSMFKTIFLVLQGFHS